MNLARRSPSGWASLALVLLPAAPLAAQVPPVLRQVTAWRLSFTLSADGSGKGADGIGQGDTYEYTYSVRASGGALLDDKRSSSWHGLPTIAVSARYKGWKSYKSSCTYTDEVTYDGPQRNLPTTAYLSFAGTKGYSMRFGDEDIRPTVKTTSVCPNRATTVSTKLATILWSPIWVVDIPYPQSATVLTGVLTAKMIAPILYGSAASSRLDATVNYRFEPVTDELRLEVTSGQYEKWRPSAALGPAPGPPIDLTATVVRADGQPAQVEVDRFTWELIDTSQEPGIAMNWPREAADSDYDLQFEPLAGQVPEGEKWQRVIRYLPPGVQDNARVAPYDWGGWSVLRVTALLKDGRRLTGRFKGANEDDVRLPRRGAGSFIADAWKEENKISDSDSADDENDPEGDANRGDGLTLYEEYRGFYENSEHIEGRPKKKDYFALNYSGSMGMGGIRHFQRVSGLAVHGKLLRNELSSARVINSNHRSAPHRVDQHGVILRDGLSAGYSEAVGGPGTPGMIEYVGLSSTMPTRPTASAAVSYASATVAHELLHTVNVWHHGWGDKSVLWRLDGNGVLIEVETGSGGAEITAGRPISVQNEADSNFTERLQAYLPTRGGSLSRKLGARGGQHSGVENCVMRYDIANAYVMKTFVGFRYTYYGDEVAGAALCLSPTGTSVNDANRNPQSRYGDAAAERGDCKHQIVVNDAVTPKKR